MAKIRIGKSRSGRDFSGAMTDISFLLIIFFLVTTVFISTQGVLIKLPELDTAPRRLHPDEIISLEIISEGKYKIGETLVNIEELVPLISGRIAALSEPILILGVNGEIKYQEVLTILEIAKENGASSFSIHYQESDPRGLKIGDQGK
ncbi:MAG: biopolymer transporter ExbD [Spirochaetales bacterium]|nr:biopolymer transporter ExbD [Spirochaetales bacterium]